MSVVALLPMKAHSERVKGKNFRLLLGRPLFRWILDSLLAVPKIEAVVINTDARSLLEQHNLQRQSRVIIRDRKPEICGDMVSMNRVLEDDVRSITADTYVMTHTTNPLLTTGTICSALDAYQEGRLARGADSLFSVNKIQNRFYRADGSAVNHDPANLIRTQDLEMWFEENSCLYLFSRESFESTSTRIGRHPILFETPKLESLDIDTEEDWRLVEAVAKLREPATT